MCRFGFCLTVGSVVSPVFKFLLDFGVVLFKAMEICGPISNFSGAFLFPFYSFDLRCVKLNKLGKGLFW